jgi:hypothetical protein
MYSRQLYWGECSKRKDGLIKGLLRLIVHTPNATPMRYFKLQLDVAEQKLILLDELTDKPVVEVSGRVPLPDDAPRLMVWAKTEVLSRLLDCYEPMYDNLPVGQQFGGLDNAPVTDGAEQQFLWELAAGSSRLSGNVDLSAMM